MNQLTLLCGKCVANELLFLSLSFLVVNWLDSSMLQTVVDNAFVFPTSFFVSTLLVPDLVFPNYSFFLSSSYPFNEYKKGKKERKSKRER